MSRMKNRHFREIGVALGLLLVASVAGAQGPSSELAPVEPVAVTELYPASFDELELEEKLGLRVEMVARADGVSELRTSLQAERGTSGMIEIRPDLEGQTYTAKRTELSRRDLELLGLPTPPSERSARPPRNIFDVTVCTLATAEARSFTGAANVPRSNTVTWARWRYTDDGGYECINLNNLGATCGPHVNGGMSVADCDWVATNDGIRNASVTSFGLYQGTPGGNPLTVGDSTTIDIYRFYATFSALNYIIPDDQPFGLQLIYTTTEYLCV